MSRYKQLTYEERNQIYALLQAEKSKPEIAKQLGRDPSTIYRELSRNKGQRGYRPKQAQRKAEERSRKPRTSKMTPKKEEYIKTKLEIEWSPEQISGTMKDKFGSSLSHETIYKYIFNNKKEGGVLYLKLRIASKKNRRKQRGSKDWRGKIPNRKDIDERPKDVEEKSRTGDWEADLVSGKRHRGYLVTLVERKSKYTLTGHVTQKTSEAVGKEIVRLLGKYKEFIHTITFDNGREFACHDRVAEELNCQCYFAKPYHSWERGLNENTNGLIRQYVPKDRDLTTITQEELDWIMNRLNHRPRKTLDFKTPHELFFNVVNKIFALRS